MKKHIISIILGLIGLSAIVWLGHRTEVDFGRCLNENGDGKVYNGEPFYNYIRYHEGIHENDIVMTVCFLNPFNNEYDDIIYRYDKVVFKDTKGDSVCTNN